MGSRFRFRTRATAMVRDLYATLEAAAIAAARRNNAALWYIPDSLAGAYGDSAGTTLPALNAPLGALLDRSFGVETLGPELITNGDFANGTAGWTAIYGGTATTSAAGVTLTTAAAGYGGISRPITLEPGKTYVASCQYTELGGSGFFMIAEQPLLTNARQFAAAEITQSGEARIQFVATIALAHVGVSQGYTSAVGLSAGFAKVSVREVIPVENLGPELIPSANTTWTAGGTGAPTVAVVGAETQMAVPSAGSAQLQTGITLAAGKSYRIDVTVTGKSGTFYARTGGGGLDASPLTLNVGRNTFTVPLGTAGQFVMGNAGSIAAGSFLNVTTVSVKEVLGFHAAQATAANKPVLVRVPRKLGPELGDAARSVSLAAFGAVTVVPNLEVGKSYRLRMSAAAGATGEVRAIYNGTGWDATKVSGSTVFSGALTATTASLGLQGTSSGATGTYEVSVREVLEWSYAIQFDTSNDTLASNLPSAGAPGVIAFHNAGETVGYASASASGFTLGYPQLAGRAVSVIVASPTAIAEGADLAAIRRFANHQRGLAL